MIRLQVFQNVNREQLQAWLRWAACGILVAGGAAVLLLPSGGENRISPVVFPFGIGAVALAANALFRPSNRVLVGILDISATLAVAYGVTMVASVPFRLSVQGICSPALSTCPLGFDHPLRSQENTAFGVAVVCGLMAAIVTLVAFEIHIKPRLEIFRAQTLPAEPPAQTASSPLWQAPAPAPNPMPTSIEATPGPAAATASDGLGEMPSDGSESKPAGYHAEAP